MLKMVETFSGIGNQVKALKKAKIKCKILNVANWDINVIIAYDLIHQGRKKMDKIKKIINTNKFNIYMLIFIILAILLITIFITFRYNVKGENNLPFYLSKISIISSIEGINNNEEKENKWSIKVNQNNDIYLYIKKNENYEETEIIENIKIENFNIQQNSKIGEVKLLKPDSNSESVIFKNNTENEVNSIEYTGDMESSIKDLKISNQGGIVVFRYAINNVGDYVSNDDLEINHNDLLKKLKINNEDLKVKFSFDICINLNSNKSYKAPVSLELPIDDVVNNGVQSKEITELENIVFKRL